MGCCFFLPGHVGQGADLENGSKGVRLDVLTSEVRNKRPGIWSL